MKIELRDYQKEQVKFLQQSRFYDPSDGKFFKENVAIQSPTGSGKTYMMLSFIKDVLDNEKNYGRNIYIAVPNIDLCYQTYNEAQNFLGSDRVHILMGKGNVTCHWNCIEGGGNPYLYDSFDRDTLKKYRYGSNRRNCGKCKYSYLCNYEKEIMAAKHPGSNLIVTNFSTLLSLDWVFTGETFSFGFIDECQMFEDFFDSHNTIEISKNSLIGAIGADNYRRLTSNGLDAQRAAMLVDGQKNSYLRTLLRKYARRGAGIINSYRWEDERNFYKINYYESYGLSNVCLVSATVDEYARRRFSVPYDNLYVEKNARIVDYSNSTFSFCGGGFSNDKLEDFLNHQIADHGIFLSTRLDLIKGLPKVIGGYEVVHSKDRFVKGKKQLLAASRSYFQGIDIEDLGFLAMNKVPFRRSDEVYQNKCKTLSMAGYNVWSDFIVGNTVTETIQAMGRLWRNKESQGNVIFFDDLKQGCRNYIVKKALNERKGIKILGEMKFGTQQETDPLEELYKRFDSVVTTIEIAYEQADEKSKEEINVLDSNVYWLNDSIYDALCDPDQKVIDKEQVEDYKRTWEAVDSLLENENEEVRSFAKNYESLLSMVVSLDRKNYREGWLNERRKQEAKEAEEKFIEKASLEQLQQICSA